MLGSVGPNIDIVGVPPAAAKWVIPESFPTKSLHRFIIAAKIGTGRWSTRINLSLTFTLNASTIPVSAGPEMRRICVSISSFQDRLIPRLLKR